MSNAMLKMVGPTGEVAIADLEKRGVPRRFARAVIKLPIS
jgi:hypothetical protein